MAERAWGLLVVGCRLLASLLLVLGKPDEVKELEFCQRDSLNLQCSNDRVLLLMVAQLGRMRLGRCVSEDRGHLGCGVDVIDELDDQCSGRRSCEVPFVTLSLKKESNCPKDLANYLGVTYSCVSVARRTTEECDAADSVLAPTAPGYLANIISAETSCGSMEHRWLIKVHPTQRVNLTLTDFGTLSYDGPEVQGDGSQCQQYGLVREREQDLWHRICRGPQRVRHEYLSAGHRIEVELVKPDSPKGLYFVLHYEAVGCAEPDVNPSMHWVKRTDKEHVVVGCYTSQQTWELTCQYNIWEGTPGECNVGNVQADVPAPPVTDPLDKDGKSKDGDPDPSKSTKGSKRLSTIAISLAVVGGLVLCISLLVIGLLFDCRRTNRRRRKAEAVAAPKECELTKKYVRRSHYEPKLEEQLEEVTSSGGQQPTQRNGAVTSIEVHNEAQPTQNGTLPTGSAAANKSSPKPPRRTTSKFASLKNAVNGTLKQVSGGSKQDSEQNDPNYVVCDPPKLQSKKNGVTPERSREVSPDSDSDAYVNTIKRAPPKKLSSVNEDKSQEVDMPTYAVCNKKPRTKAKKKQTRKPKPTPRVSKMRPPAVPEKKNVHSNSSDSDDPDGGYERPVAYGPPGGPLHRRHPPDGNDSESSDDVPFYFELDPRYTGVYLMERSDSASSQESAPEEEAVHESLA